MVSDVSDTISLGHFESDDLFSDVRGLRQGLGCPRPEKGTQTSRPEMGSQMLEVRGVRGVWRQWVLTWPTELSGPYYKVGP
jgi:hypothetical protein